MKWILIAVGVIAGLVILVTIIGALLPRSHVASRSARFNQPPETIWEAITDIERFTSWRSDLKQVERLPDRNGHTVWRETSRQGTMTIEVVESTAPSRLVGRIADPDLPFGGSWTYEIAPVDGGSKLTITENGEVYNPIFRFMARVVFGHHATIEQYLKALGTKFGEEVTPMPVEGGA